MKWKIPSKIKLPSMSTFINCALMFLSYLFLSAAYWHLVVRGDMDKAVWNISMGGVSMILYMYHVPCAIN
jgi:hypothetical protein